MQEPAGTEPTTAEPGERDEMPSWLLEFGAAGTEPAQPVEPEAVQEEPAEGEALPEWLLGMQAEEEQTLPGAISADQSVSADQSADEETLPEWLSEEPTATEAAETPIDEIPDWLRTGALAAAAGDAADWLAVKSPEPGGEPPSAQAPSPEATPELAEAFAWLARMMTPLEPKETMPAGPVEAGFEEQETPPEISPEPGRLEAMDQDLGEFESAIEPPALSTAELDALLAEMPLEPAEGETMEQAGALSFEAPAAAAAEPIELEETPSETAMEAHPAEAAAETAAAGDKSIETAAAVEPGAPAVAAEAAAPAETFDFPLDGDDAFAWLESLAVKQGAQEALLLTPEERTEKPPEWVQQAAEEAAEEAAVEAPDAAPEESQALDELSAAEPPAEAQEEPELPKTAELKYSVGLAPKANVEQAGEGGLPVEESPWAEAGAIAPPPASADEDFDEVASPFIEDETPPAAPGAAEAPPQVNWMDSEETEYLLDDMQSAPTEKLGAAPAAHPDPETETERIPPGAGREAPAPPPTAPDAPDLPAWLAGVETEGRDEVVEWRPPTFTRRRYDLNLASLVELERLPGIGFIMAQRVVNYRETNGPFQRVEDLLQVPEFSPYTLEIIRENLFVIPSTSQPVRSEPVSARTSTRRKPTESAAPPAQPAAEPAAEPVSSGRRSQRRGAPPERPAAPVPASTLHDAEAPAEIQEARGLSEHGDWDAAQATYDRLIQSGQHLEWVIGDLNSASLVRPEDIEIWQSLGDAYMRANRLKEAMQSYSQAEKLLR